MRKTLPLLFEKSVENRRTHYLSKCDVEELEIPKNFKRKVAPKLPELSETDITRHYTALEANTFGINDGFYPLGSCTMKYNPKINDKIASLPGFAEIHPLQPENTVQGIFEALEEANKSLSEITGMDIMSFQPAAGAHGELASLMMFKKYFEDRGETNRIKIIIPDSAHGTNPATVHMCGMKVINLKSNEKGCIDVEELKSVIDKDLAGIMLTNPNTLGIFEEDILEITKIIHDAGGLCYYDGANLNAIAGILRPGDMGFDCIHLNLHKTFSTPHGGGGPGSGAIGCKEFLRKYLPGPQIEKEKDLYKFNSYTESIGQLVAFYGNTLITLRALAFIMSYGKEGIPKMSKHAVLNANYLKQRLSERFDIFNKNLCMHEFIITMEKEAKNNNFTAKDMAKAILDEGMMAPTMYFPLIVKEALMVEPTETEGKETLDFVADKYIKIYDDVVANPELAKQFPKNTIISRPDEVTAARSPIVKYMR
ncbi:MAG: aminomethyl-transferring glycine dehydrogenase subunit GcvPB [Defluviitaleaceae bacterium]|nr:aminomethyl-transferring glycine dehydrogenase subunit GcvPB [Defluviitaleaceae bacterium]